MSLRQPAEDEPTEFRDNWAYLKQRWHAEMIQLWADFRAWLNEDRAPLPVIVIDENLLKNGGAEVGIGSERRKRIEQALSQIFGRTSAPRDVIVEIPKGEVLHTRVQLPKVGFWTLRKILGHELARLSPVEPELLYFDFDVKRTDRASRRIDVDLRIVKRHVIDEAIAACLAVGLRVSAIQFAGEARPADWQQFPIDRAALGRLLWRRWSVGILAGAAIVLGLFVVATVIAREAAWNDAVAGAVETERSRALIVDRLERKARMANAAANFVARQKRAPMFVEILADISRLLPEDTWVSELTLSGNRMRLQGTSRSASDLIAVFDRSPRFANAEFTAPLTKDDQTKGEHFDLSFDVRTR